MAGGTACGLVPSLDPLNATCSNLRGLVCKSLISLNWDLHHGPEENWHAQMSPRQFNDTTNFNLINLSLINGSQFQQNWNIITLTPVWCIAFRDLLAKQKVYPHLELGGCYFQPLKGWDLVFSQQNLSVNLGGHFYSQISSKHGYSRLPIGDPITRRWWERIWRGWGAAHLWKNSMTWLMWLPLGGSLHGWQLEVPVECCRVGQLDKYFGYWWMASSSAVVFCCEIFYFANCQPLKSNRLLSERQNDSVNYWWLLEQWKD